VSKAEARKGFDLIRLAVTLFNDIEGWGLFGHQQRADPAAPAVRLLDVPRGYWGAQ
jgi:hypothetical protein